MKAFKVESKLGCEGVGKIVFAESASKAKSICYRSERDFSEYTALTVHRLPEFDKYEPGPIPHTALVEAGWWFECEHCGRHIEECTQEKVKCDDGWCCSRKCLDKYNKNMATHDA